MTLRSLLLHDVALKQDQMEEVLNLSSMKFLFESFIICVQKPADQHVADLCI